MVHLLFYYVKDPATGKLKRIRTKVNRIKGIKEKRKVARITMAAIGERLALGWNPLLEESAPRTYNNYLSFLCSLWEWMLDRGFAAENVFRSFKRKPRRLMQKKRRLLTDEEVARLFSFLERENPEYLAVVILCYCCFVRPKEIALLRCGDIDLRKGLVHVRAETAKNDSESFRTIPDAARPYLVKLDLSRPDFFLFGRHNGTAGDFSPGKGSRREEKVLRLLEDHGPAGLPFR